MKVAINTKPIIKRAKAEKLDINNYEVEQILKYYFEDSIDKLSKGEVLKIPGIGRITPSYKAGVSYLNQENPLEYETIKFNFSPFTTLKSKAKERLSSVQKKNI